MTSLFFLYATINSYVEFPVRLIPELIPETVRERREERGMEEHEELQMRLLREQLARMMRDDQRATPSRDKVIKELNLEGIATHIRKIMKSDDSTLQVGGAYSS